MFKLQGDWRRIFSIYLILLVPFLLAGCGNNGKEESLKTPASPSNLQATTVSSSQINLTWVDNSDNEVGFKIEHKRLGEDYLLAGQVLSNEESYQDSSLKCEKYYYFRVSASNGFGDSEFSNEVYTATYPCSPTSPSNLQATAIHSSQVDLAWKDNSDNEDGFKIERKTGVDGTYSLINTTGANVINYSDVGLPSQDTIIYFYRVYSFNLGGNSDNSNDAYAITSYCMDSNWTILDSAANANDKMTYDSFNIVNLRCLKISVTKTNDDGQVNIYEIQVFGPDSPTTNLALNKPTVAISSQGGIQGGQNPGKAVDGDEGSRWASDRTYPGPASDALPHWIIVDLGQSLNVNKIIVFVGGYDQSYALSYGE